MFAVGTIANDGTTEPKEEGAGAAASSVSVAPVPAATVAAAAALDLPPPPPPPLPAPSSSGGAAGADGSTPKKARIASQGAHTGTLIVNAIVICCSVRNKYRIRNVREMQTCLLLRVAVCYQ